MNPLDAVGPVFLGLYVASFVVALTFALVLRGALRMPSEDDAWEPKPLDAYESAYLAGGEQRVSLAAIASLVNFGVLEVGSDGRVVKTGGAGSSAGLHPIEAALAKSLGQSAVKIGNVGKGVSAPLHESLIERGLLVGNGTANLIQWVTATPMGLLLAFGLLKINIGISRGRPVGFLVALCIATAVTALILFCKRPHRSRLGDRVLASVKRESATVGYTAKGSLGTLSKSDVAMAVGLFGVTAMAGDSLANLRRAMSPNGNGSACGGGSSGCGGGGGGCGGGGGGCGGGGCGGGGCGGCGS